MQEDGLNSELRVLGVLRGWFHVLHLKVTGARGDPSRVCRAAGEADSGGECASILLPMRLFDLDLDEEEVGEGEGDVAWREGHSWSKSFQGALTERCAFLDLRDAPACNGSTDTGTTVVHCTCGLPS